MVDTKDEDIDDEMVWDINREKAMMAPQRIKLVTKYILEHFDQKTYRGYKTYAYNTLMMWQRLFLPTEVLWKKLRKNSV